MKLNYIFSLFLLIFIVAATNVWDTGAISIRYVRVDGGNATQCDGLSDHAYPPVAGTACAMNSPEWLFPARSGSSTLRAAQAGDLVVIESGAYRVGCQNASNCSDSNVNVIRDGFCSEFNTYDCYMNTVPNSVQIVGCTTSGCSTQAQRPELWGAGRVKQILKLTGTTGVTVKDLVLTDHATCGEYGGPFTCGPADAAELSAQIGIDATSSTGATITDVNIHGLWHSAMEAGYIANLTINGDTAGASAFDFNSSVGINFDTCNNDHTCGVTNGHFVKMLGNNPNQMFSISWNGCTEDYAHPGTPASCSSQSSGGYGDAFGTTSTSGNWTLNYVRITHNTSDGADLLYCENAGCTVDIRNSHMGQNIGNQIKSSGNVTIYNTLIEGDCDFFAGKSYSLSGIDTCRANGHPVAIAFQAGTTAKFYGNTLVNVKGDGAFLLSNRNLTACTSANTMDIQNSIIATTSGKYFSYKSNPGDGAGNDCNNAGLTQINSNISGFTTNPTGSGNIFTNPNLSGTFDGSVADVSLSSTSPGRDSANETASGQPTTDFNAFNRGISYDMGFKEFLSTYSGTPPVCGDNNLDAGETCDGTALNSQTCATQGFVSGTLSCAPNCGSYVTSACVASNCGNGTVDSGEQCDGSNLNGQSCTSQGYSTGTLSCSSCAFNTSACVAAVCGNGIVDSGEQCDDHNTTNGDGCSSICEPEVAPYEKFLTYTETDPASYTSVHTNYVNFTGVPRNASVNTSFDFGASHFGDFTHRFKVRVDACNDNGTGGAARGGVWNMSSASRADFSAMETNDDGANLYLKCFSSSSSYTWFLDGYNSSTEDTWADVIPVLVRYIEVQRAGSTLTAKIYSDANYTTLLHTLSINSGATAYRYFYPIMSYNDGTTGTSISGRVENYDLTYTTAPVTPTTYGTKLSGCTCYGANLK